MFFGELQNLVILGPAVSIRPTRSTNSSNSINCKRERICSARSSPPTAPEVFRQRLIPCKCLDSFQLFRRDSDRGPVALLPLLAGLFNDKLNVGDAAPAWKDLPGVDDKKHSLDDFQEKEILVVIFTCNSCPVATDYEDRLCDFGKKFSETDSKVGVVAINVNKIKEDQLPAMKKRPNRRSSPFPTSTMKLSRSPRNLARSLLRKFTF